MDWVPIAIVGGLAAAFYIRKKYKQQIALAENLAADRGMLLGLWYLSGKQAAFSDGDVMHFSEVVGLWKDSKMLISQRHVKIIIAARIHQILEERGGFLNPQDMNELLVVIEDTFEQGCKEFRDYQGRLQIMRSLESMSRPSEIPVN